jgi:alpha-glucosidase
MSRNGTPIVRPLFLEFPRATRDLHPIDLDAEGEFLFGRDLLVAPAPFPDKLDSYVVQLPGEGWYDYWTGEKVARGSAKTNEPGTVTVKPNLETLPVYARAGAIIPMQPLVQSTKETPEGPLTLRVYPGSDCSGTLYQDDGTSFAYRNGDFLRMDFRCEQKENSVLVHLGEHEGHHPAWWKQVQLVIFGSYSAPVKATAANNIEVKTEFDGTHHVTSTMVTDDGKGSDVRLEWRP